MAPGRPIDDSAHDPQYVHSLNTFSETDTGVAAHVIQRTYAWDTFASGSQAPNDSGSVAILDGGLPHPFARRSRLADHATASILLTSFRSQNVPPPMSAFQLSLPVAANALRDQSTLPVHVTFTAGSDVLVSLWETGSVKVTDLRTRLGPGKGPVMSPIEVWSGLVFTNPSAARSYRQIAATRSTTHSGLTLVALGGDGSSDTTDFVSVTAFDEGKIEDQFDISMPHRNGRLIPSERGAFWQAPDGAILSSTVTSSVFNT